MRPPWIAWGAGDAFADGFLYGILGDRPVRVCARLGQIVVQSSLQAAREWEALFALPQVRRAYRPLFRSRLG